MEKQALVLGGGGARGSYEIGVWKALIELNWDFQIVTGTSVGSLNGALITQDNYCVAEELWQNITTDQVIAISDEAHIEEAMGLLKTAEVYLKSLPKEEIGLNTDPLGELLHRYVDEEAIRSAKRKLGIVTICMEPPHLIPQELFVEDIPQGLLADYLWASSSMYPVLKAKLIENAFYIDGGGYDNLPINLALTQDVTKIVAVSLNAIGHYRKYELKENQTLTLIEPFWDLGALFHFHPTASKRNMALGYFDTMKSFGQYKGYYYTFPLTAFSQILPEKAAGFGALQKIMQKKGADLGGNQLAKKFKNRCTLKTEPLLMAAECAGEIFGVDPTLQYTETTFHQQVEESVKTYILDQKVKDLFGFDRRRTIKKRFMSLDAKGRVAVLYRSIAASEKDSSFTKVAMAALFPWEFMAAMYLWNENIIMG